MRKMKKEWEKAERWNITVDRNQRKQMNFLMQELQMDKSKLVRHLTDFYMTHLNDNSIKIDLLKSKLKEKQLIDEKNHFEIAQVLEEINRLKQQPFRNDVQDVVTLRAKNEFAVVIQAKPPMERIE